MNDFNADDNLTNRQIDELLNDLSTSFDADKHNPEEIITMLEDVDLPGVPASGDGCAAQPMSDLDGHKEQDGTSDGEVGRDEAVNADGSTRCRDERAPSCDETDENDKTLSSEAGPESPAATHPDLDAPANNGSAHECPFLITENETSLVESARLVFDALAASGRFFEQRGRIVTVNRDSTSGEFEVTGVNSADLLLAVDALTIWQKFDRRSEALVRSTPSEGFCRRMLRTNVADLLPALTGIVNQPTFAPDGTLSVTPGYDAHTGYYGAYRTEDFPLLWTADREGAQTALAVLCGLLAEFPFVTEVDRAAALAAMLTAVTRSSFAAAPLFLTRAFAPGTGKSFLNALITALATPKESTALPFPHSNQEFDRVILAALGDAAPVLDFDNITRPIPAYGSLCSAITSGKIKGRVLGSSTMKEVSTRVLLLCSGNNVGPAADMARRVLTIALDSRHERPSSRSFSNPRLLEVVRADRGRFVMAALTIVKAWRASGERLELEPFAGFEEWSNFCRAPLVWLGLPDPIANVHAAVEEDGDRALLGRLLDVIEKAVGRGPVRVRDLVEWASRVGSAEAADIRELLEEIAPAANGINRKSLGRWIQRHVGQVINGKRLMVVPRNANTVAWQVTAT